MEGAKHRGEEPAIGARRRAQQPTPRAIKSLWEPWRPAAWDAWAVADAGRIAAQQLVASCECISGDRMAEMHHEHSDTPGPGRDGLEGHLGSALGVHPDAPA
jgi:hypothetical protein